MYTQFAFYLAVSFPCFLCLIHLWKVSTAMKNGLFFGFDAANQIRRSGIILFVDLCCFFLGNLIFMFLGWNDFYMIYLVIFFIGIAIDGLLIVLYRYIIEACDLKEEVEGTI